MNEIYNLFTKWKSEFYFDEFSEEEILLMNIDFKRVLAHNSMNANTLELLSHEKDYVTHIGVCKSMHTQKKVLEEIFLRADKKDEHTFIALAENIMTPEEILFEMIKNPCCDTFILIVIHNPNVSIRILNYLQHNPELYQSAEFIRNEINKKINQMMEEEKNEFFR